MTTIQDIISHVESLTGHPLGREERLFLGEADRDISAATVCWMATPGAIHAAGTKGHDLLIAHESLYYPYDAPDAHRLPPDWESWSTNRQRRELLSAYDLTFLRLHVSADEICIFDDFARVLGFGEPVTAQGLTKVFEIAPCSLGELVERVKMRLGMPAVRVSVVEGLEQPVHRVGLPWGGLGLFVNVGYQQELIELGCDALIAGESDNYGFRFAQELGIPMIETSHEISENPGLRHFAALLAEAFPEVTLSFHENPVVWQML
jgi:putative NIF3 family GTP cyclohydrolase 1 type 2